MQFVPDHMKVINLTASLTFSQSTAIRLTTWGSRRLTSRRPDLARRVLVPALGGEVQRLLVDHCREGGEDSHGQQLHGVPVPGSRLETSRFLENSKLLLRKRRPCIRNSNTQGDEKETKSVHNSLPLLLAFCHKRDEDVDDLRGVLHILYQTINHLGVSQVQTNVGKLIQSGQDVVMSKGLDERKEDRHLGS